VDNKADALARIGVTAFCLVVLDLQIKETPRALKGHREHGASLLREIRKRYPEHHGSAYWLPVVIVSGYAREMPEALDAMKDGASDVIEKPFTSRRLSEQIREALERSGRRSHDLCAAPPAMDHSERTKGPVTLAIPGERDRRQTIVLVGVRRIGLPDRLLKILLRLMVAQRSNKGVHKTDLGARDDQGFKGISELRNVLKPALNGVNIISNDYHGEYRLVSVEIGACNAAALAQLGDRGITELAAQVSKRPRARRRKV
jgi:CheY-like chemotaxis protein